MRLSDWEPRLSAYLAGVASRPHAYGRHDCLQFIAAAIEAQTGVNLAMGYRGKYRSAAGASRYLRELGFADPAELVGAHLTDKPVLMALRGDIVADVDGIPGVCVGGDALFVGMEDGLDGLIRQPRRRWSRAWKV
ncbi:DUF6950 family protein [Tsuneonella sp. HG222]